MITERGRTTRSLLKNSISQIVGRLLLSAMRLLTTVLIVRYLGSDRFGEYALLLSFLLIFEWLSDFGQTDIAVRDIAREGEKEAVVLRALAWLKLMHGVGLALLLPAVIWALQYPPAVVEAAVAGSVGLLFYAGAQVFRTVFKVRMRMERDVLAELAGTVVLIPLTWWACREGAGIQVLIACYAVSRVVFFVAAVLLARGEAAAGSGVGGPAPGALRLFREALPLGVIGLMVGVYDGLAPILLSKIADLHAVALYSAAARYVFPVITVVQALVAAFFPLLSRLWNNAPAQLTALQQTALEAALLVAMGFVCIAVASADFLMSLIGPTVAQGAPVLQVMCAVVLVRTVSTAMSPLLVIGGRQNASLGLTIAAIILQVLFLALLTPRFGAIGAALGYLMVELLALVPMALIGQRVTGAKLSWGAPLRLVASGAAAILVARLTPVWGDWPAGLLCPAVFLVFAVASNALSLRKLQAMYADATGRPIASAANYRKLP